MSAAVGVRRPGLWGWWPRRHVPSWEAAPPGVGRDQAQPPSLSCLLLEEKLRRRGEFGAEVAPGRPLEQVASVSLNVINHK